MSNNEFQNYLPDSIPLSKRLAKQSANPTSSGLEFQNITKRRRSTGSQFALYTWGTLATLSVVLSAGFLVTEIKIQESVRIADLEIQQHRVATRIREQGQNDQNLAKLPRSKSPIRSLAHSLLPADSVDQFTTASVTKAQERVNSVKVAGYGVSIGNSSSPNLLPSRYLALSNHAPELFIGLQPKVQLSRSVQNKNKANLVVGPFLSEKELFAFCKNLRSRMAVDCTQENYSGKNLILPPIL